MRAEVITAHGLSHEEYARACELLGREVTLAELGVIGAMWSEHCSYKSSKIYLERFYSHNEQVIEGPGENAGVVRLDEEGKWALAFKMESHNHPSQIEPVQGAATGVGGILRDIFAMGARPIALMNSLRFGRPDAPRMQHLIHGVVEGISSYGNCIGVPNVGGETLFDACYEQNILVNVFALGLVERAKLKRAAAPHAGCVLVYYGARTGRDGMHGATMASEQFGEDVQDRRPAVQVGDPFQGKLLMEATLELVQEDLVLAVQDMGAAGLTSSSVEMAYRGGVGVRLDLDEVPCREANMTAREMLLSESQERMLAVIHREDLPRVEQIVREKWELSCAVIGELTVDPVMCVWRAGEVEVCLPIALLTRDAPRYQRPTRAPEERQEVGGVVEVGIETAEQLELAGLALLRRPDIASKRQVYERYDSEVGLRTLERSGEAAAAVMWIHECEAKIALSVDCQAKLVRSNPRHGAAHAVAECARNLSCTGATPRAMTDCLNFGDPTIPEVMWQFAEATRGLDEAARALDIPIVSGNVSLYNASMGKSIDPTPIVAMVGVFDSPEKRHVSTGLRNNGERLCVLRVASWSDVLSLEGSELARMYGEEGGVPPLDLDAERALQRVIRAAIARGDVSAAQDCSQGGLWVALVEMVLASKRSRQRRAPLGLRVDRIIEAEQGIAHCVKVLFAESASQIVLTCDDDALERLRGEVDREPLIALEMIGEVVQEPGISWPSQALSWSEESLQKAHEV